MNAGGRGVASSAGGPSVYAVEDTAVQIVWRSLPVPPSREVTFGVGASAATVVPGPPTWASFRLRGVRPSGPGPAGPGGVIVGGLEPGIRYRWWWQPAGGDRVEGGSVETLRPPPGAELARFATVSDLHIGERRFGVLGGIRDVQPAPAAPYPLRAAAAALDEAAAFGAEVVVWKGDLTGRARVQEFEAVAALARGCGVPALLQLGNHDRRRGVRTHRALGDLPYASDGRPLVRDLAGVRLVLADSPSPEDRWGHLDDEQVERIVDAVTSAPHPAVVSLHHPPERWPVPTSYPPGVTRADSRRLLDALRGAGAALVIAGHSHRNRTYRIGGLLVAEVGSTKDHPGGWAGYVVHEGGIRQVVRRTARRDVIGWTDATAAALGGLWGWWSPGRLTDRCWSVPWPGPGPRRS